MKNVIRIAFLALIAFAAYSCKEDEVEVFDAPEFTVSAASTSVKVGQTTDITIALSAVPGKVASVTASVAGSGTIALNNAAAVNGQAEGTVTGTFTAGNTTGAAVLTVTVTDQQGSAKQTVKTLALTVTELDPPSIALSAANSTNDIGQDASTNITFGAEAGLASYKITSGEMEVMAGDLTGTSSQVAFAYTVKATDASGNKVFTIEVTDDNGTVNTTNFTVTINPASPLDRVALAFSQWGNQVVDPQFAANSIKPTNAAISTGAEVLEDDWFDVAAYRGAVDPNAATPWYAENTWSFYAHLIQGVADKTRPQGANIINVNTADLNGDGQPDAAKTSVTWTKNNTYVLNGFVFVEDGETLTIEPGTVVKGKPGTAESASALIIARGGKINAVGTSSEPIIMTYEADPLDGTATAQTRGQWGGLIILGKAPLNSANGTTAIEGIPTSEPRGLYGGNIANDNSGTIKYVSIRHGGTNIGAGNEINGLTLGGVGSETIIDFVEIIGNDDDGIEWFGGNANGKHLIVAFAGDDALDYDEGYRGKNQFVIAHQDGSSSGASDRGGEHDGGTTPETGTPYAIPHFVNVTSVGSPTERALTFRDNAGGFYINSIFTGYQRGADFENLCNEEQDTFKQIMDGNLALRSNVWFNINAGAATTGSAIFKVETNFDINAPSTQCPNETF